MIKLLKKIFLFDKHTCPWWLAYSWDHRLRKLIHNPDTFIRPLLKPGDKTADLGCGMGYFSVAMARYVGTTGRVFSVDIQEKMLDALKKRIAKFELQNIITPVLTNEEKIPSQGPFDFILSFWMLHKVNKQVQFLEAWMSLLKETGTFLLVEPKIHISNKKFDLEIERCIKVGLEIIDYPRIGLSRSILFKKPTK
jgi:ubiquinone/menaquinone biosynthesis C-methylase UbiE